MSAGIVDEIRTTKVTRYGSVNATGKLAASMEVEQKTQGYRVLLFGYARELVFGRKPGAMPPVEPLAEWAKAKGLTISPWAIAKKIARDGTTVWQENQGRSSGLFEKTIDAEITLVTSQVAAFYAASIISGFNISSDLKP
jgi:hypothetical protein